MPKLSESWVCPQCGNVNLKRLTCWQCQYALPPSDAEREIDTGATRPNLTDKTSQRQSELPHPRSPQSQQSRALRPLPYLLLVALGTLILSYFLAPPASPILVIISATLFAYTLYVIIRTLQALLDTL